MKLITNDGSVAVAGGDPPVAALVAVGGATLRVPIADPTAASEALVVLAKLAADHAARQKEPG